MIIQEMSQDEQMKIKQKIMQFLVDNEIEFFEDLDKIVIKFPKYKRFDLEGK